MRENGTSNHQRPCIHVRPGAGCVEGLLPAVYEAALVHSETHHHRSNHGLQPDQSTSAIIYVSIVVVFYVVIIAVLVGTTLRRRGLGSDEPEDTKHLLLYDEKTDSVTTTPAVPTSKIHEAGLLTV
ncbi:uncharacterized protein LOC123520765 [Portunus trituberculatus]|uniref:uncharacterized protein LOC123520765 n=1 Tax=Portunus trituberculatus TaxID=210409 RepID=UPI001E1CFDEC|nr:uncharacterized protein LOC123520765 [Portunus trituberculatus]XP_045139270.1 uncharacterized protein LOC123520765 [Portunus trituberculatus]XP_045139271.1 uncharacterized protein LOC123520765 [Portunus trituberculatus]XP_045139272.1 uncharacterized protein LOC123520765 [Portunus trituberculatus]